MVRRVVCCLLFATSLAAQAAPVPVVGAVRWTLERPGTGERYELSVMLPHGADTARARPLLFVLDGTEDFALAAATADLVRAECELADAPLVVALGDGARIDAPGNRRGRDYTPTRSDVAWARGDGGAPAFLAFLRETVLPFVERHYRVTGTRTFFGYSYGGLFGAYALHDAPTLFSHWILGSPSVFYDDEVVVRRLRSARRIAGTGPRVLLTAGGREDWAQAGTASLATALRSGFGPSVTVTTRVLPDVGHAMGKLEAMRHGFTWAACPAPGPTPAPAAPAPIPEVRQLVTFRFVPGRVGEALAIYRDSLLPVYRDVDPLRGFRLYREAESPVPLDVIVESRYAGMAGMDAANAALRRPHRSGVAAFRLYGVLSGMTLAHTDEFVAMRPPRPGAAPVPAGALTVFESLRLVPGGRGAFAALLEDTIEPWETGRLAHPTETGEYLVSDGWDVLRVHHVASLGEWQARQQAERDAPFAAARDALVAARRVVLVKRDGSFDVR